jgi:hypothetical protein
MRKKGVLVFLIVMAILLVSSNFSESQSDYVETWVPYRPSSEQVDLEFWMGNQTAYINITITFPTAGYDISSWGEVTKDGYILWANSEIWHWTGMCAQVITPVSHTYELGYLESGNYTFTFKAWGIDIKSIDFTVARAGVIDLAEQHDVAVIDVTTSKAGGVPMPTVSKWHVANVTVTVENQGGFAETFNVTAFANSSAIGEQQVTLNPGENKTLTFIWDTTGFSYGNYTVKAVADTVPGETDTIDNTYIDGVIKVVIPGDVDGNGRVNILDAIKVAGAFGSKQGDGNWNPNADINGDGVVNILDAINLAGHFGETV